MNVVDILNRAREYELEVSAQIEHVERLRRIAAIEHKSSAYSQQIVEKLAALERDINRSIDRAADAKKEALDLIGHLTGEERSVIEHYYILGEKWEVVARKTYMSERRVFIVRQNALDKLSKIKECDNERITEI